MNMMDIFKSMLGINYKDYSSGNPDVHNDFRNPIWNVDDDDDSEDELHQVDDDDDSVLQGESFSALMEEYAEQQMDKVMDLLSLVLFKDFTGNFCPSADLPLTPARPGKPAKNIREEYIKPGYLNSSKKVDSDLDKGLSANDLDSILDGIGKLQKSNSGLEMDEAEAPGFNMYFKQVVTRSVTRPDGSTETTTTVRKSDGTEETTTVVTQGDGRTIMTENPFKHPLPAREEFWKKFFEF